MSHNGEDLPAYFDPQYKCEMQVLRFDSAQPNPRYQGWVDECLAHLQRVAVVMSGQNHASWLNSTRNLELVLNERVNLLDKVR